MQATRTAHTSPAGAMALAGPRHVAAAAARQALARGRRAAWCPVPAAAGSQLAEPQGAADGDDGSVRVDLPKLTKDFLPDSVKLPDAAFGADRAATALFFPPSPGATQPGGKVPCVVFAHAFAVPPSSYTSTFKVFRDQGWAVIAPTTSLFDVVKAGLSRQEIETTTWRSKPPAKLQTALILDTLRSVQHLRESRPEIGDLVVVGHSMGGAAAMIAAGKLGDAVKGVAVMAPAVKQTLKTAVNERPGLHMGDAQGRADAITFFAEDYPASAPLHVLGAEDDLIVQKKEVQHLFTAALAGDQSGDLQLYWLQGSHIGFMDGFAPEFDIPEPVNSLVAKPLIFLVNVLLYRLEVFKLLLGDYSDQRVLTQQVVTTALREALAGAGVDGVRERASAEVRSVMGKATLEDVQRYQAAVEQDKPQDAPWVLPTALLLAYSAVHASSLRSCLDTFSSHGGALSPSSLVGLGIVAAIATGLVYENVVLSAGRFITDRGTKNLDLLDALNDPRFLFHSAAPLLSVAGLDMAQRAGVDWASSPWLAGGVTAACLAVVGLSTIRNTLLLETKPTWSWGIFHFTFDDEGFDFTRIIPVAVTTVLLTALGAAAALEDAAFLPFMLGPAACLALSAGIIPRSVAPMILTGNGGEAAMIASLAYTEALLAALGR